MWYISKFSLARLFIVNQEKIYLWFGNLEINNHGSKVESVIWLRIIIHDIYTVVIITALTPASTPEPPTTPTTTPASTSAQRSTTPTSHIPNTDPTENNITPLSTSYSPTTQSPSSTQPQDDNTGRQKSCSCTCDNSQVTIPAAILSVVVLIQLSTRS